jgi:hypothetical protein
LGYRECHGGVSGWRREIYFEIPSVTISFRLKESISRRRKVVVEM